MSSPALREVVLPELGLGDTPLRLNRWLVPLGRTVIAGDPLAEILGGSALVELPAPASGVLVSRLVLEDALLQRGQRLALIESDEDNG